MTQIELTFQYIEADHNENGPPFWVQLALVSDILADLHGREVETMPRLPHLLRAMAALASYKDICGEQALALVAEYRAYMKREDRRALLRDRIADRIDQIAAIRREVAELAGELEDETV